MFSRFAFQFTRIRRTDFVRCRSIVRFNSTSISRTRFRRVFPFIVLSGTSIPIGYVIYRNFVRDAIFKSDFDETFDENSESVSQSELDNLRSETQRLLDTELYRTRSSSFFIPIRLVFRTLKLIILFTPVALFYFIQDKFAPNYFESWCWTLKRTFEYCGPCFIKLGQWMATRPDLFSWQFCQIFNEFHSNAPTHSLEETERILRENRISLESMATKILSKPLASGAIAQVYRCQLGTNDLVMKIRHPGVQDRIFCDLKILNLLTKMFSTKSLRWMNIEENIAAFTKNMLLQTNLLIEAKNLKIFEKNFESYQSNIRFPHVDATLPTTRDVLFQSYEEGQSFNEFLATCKDEKLRKKLAHLGINAYLKMVFVDNFVHADLHPGNMLVRFDGTNVKLIFLDVGLTSSLTRKDKKNFYDLFRAITNYDAEQAASLMIIHAPNAKEIDENSKNAFRKEMSILIDRVVRTPLKNLEVGLVLRNVLDLGKKYHIQVESNFTTIALGTVIIEGIGRQLDPDLDFVAAAKPYLQRDFRLVKAYLHGVFQRNFQNSFWSKLFQT